VDAPDAGDASAPIPASTGNLIMWFLPRFLIEIQDAVVLIGVVRFRLAIRFIIQMPARSSSPSILDPYRTMPLP
jgi:hypothetical protein